MARARRALAVGVTSLVLSLAGVAQQAAPAAPVPQPTQAPPAGPGLKLYRQLGSVGIDPSAVYGIREAALDRGKIHISLDDGTIGFLQSVDGRVTGAFFQGQGEILVIPPDRAERGSLALFTGAAVLEEQFTSAYFRFNDDTAEQLRPALRPAEDSQSFLSQWEGASSRLAEGDALRLMISFLNQPPPPPGDHLLHARLDGSHLGVFDVYFDTLSAEQVAILKFARKGGLDYYDVLTSFGTRTTRNPSSEVDARSMVESTGTLNRLHIGGYKVSARIEPPTQLDAEAQLDIEVRQGGDRLVIFELSRQLRVRDIEADGKPLEFLQNEAIEGSALARKGDDLVAVVFPEPLRAGQRLQLKFAYAGSVLSDAGGGLLYVGARGTWYPNRGMSMANFDLEFRYPANWTLVATGKRMQHASSGEQQVSRWVSERPLPLAGFNLGQYTMESANADGVVVQAYATAGVERAFRVPETVVVPPPLPPVRGNPQVPAIIAVPAVWPSPARNAEAVAETSARAIKFFDRAFGPYPYGSLALAQMPGTNSQGWPGLVFLSSYAFLSPEERAHLRLRPSPSLFFDQFMQVHETAHQWWGDLIGWKSYRDQWLVEALANYSAILALEKTRPQLCKAVLDEYRAHLLSKSADGEEVTQAGAVTLGLRLSNSHFPDGYTAVSYGRGAWLMHMLRTMLRDTAKPGAEQDEPFLRALRRLRQRFEGRDMSTRDFQQALEEELPESLRYEGRKSLDWFFDTWVNGTAIPRLELKDVRFTRNAAGDTVSFTILQKQAPDQLITSVPIYAQTAHGLALLGRVFADSPSSSFRLKAPPDARKLVLDPYETVLTRP